LLKRHEVNSICCTYYEDYNHQIVFIHDWPKFAKPGKLTHTTNSRNYAMCANTKPCSVGG